MAGKEEGHTDDTRGTSPVVGIVLLFGFVIVGALLVFVVGSSMFDAVESEANREQVRLCASEADHRLETVARTGYEQPFGFGNQRCRPDVSEGGTIELVWYDNSTEDPPWNDDDRNVSRELGTLEFELDDRTIAHQGGGIWELSDGETTVVSEPDIGYDGDSLQLNIMRLDEEQLGTSDRIARPDHDEAAALTTEISEAADRSPDGTDIAFRIESPYHEGWERYLEDGLGEEEYDEVNVTRTGDVVEVRIHEVREPEETATIVVAEDRGLSGPGANVLDHDQRLDRSLGGGPNNAVFTIEALIENTGDTEETRTVTASIWDEDLDTELLEASEEVTLSPGETEAFDRNELKFQHGEYKDELSHGETYKYILATEDDRTDDPPGSFYVGKSGSHFNVTGDDIETTSTGDGNVTITASVRNHGVERGTRNVAIEFEDYDITASEELTLDYGANGTVSWTVNESALPSRPTEFGIRTGDDEATGTVVGAATGDGAAFAVVAENGVGDDQIVTDEEPFTVEAIVENTYSDTRTQNVELTIPDADVTEPVPKTLGSGERDTVAFEVSPEEYDLEPGTVYEYDIEAGDGGLNETGTFYVGKPGTHFELSNENATVSDGTVTIAADLTNVGTDNGSETVSLDLEYQDEMPPELEDENLYGRLSEREINRSFGESDRLELTFNESKLLQGEYEATIETESGSETVEFPIDTGIDPGRAGLGEVEDANVTVEVVGSQVSYWGDLAPMTLDVVTGGETEHSFSNPRGGDNINIGPTWQDKSDDSYTHTFTVNETTELTLRNSRYGVCDDEETASYELPHYSGQRDLSWCNDVSGDEEFGPIDASQNRNLQNVRVRSAENDTIPALPTGMDEQISATEALEQRGLLADDENTLDLESNEFVFLFDNTADCGSECDDDDDIDALWDDAVEAYERRPDQTNDPDFNDLIVYVQVERAGVEPGTPSITIQPGGGESVDVDAGDGRNAGGVDSVDAELDGETDENGSPDLETGNSDTSGGSGMTGDTDVDIETDHVVIG